MVGDGCSIGTAEQLPGLSLQETPSLFSLTHTPAPGHPLRTALGGQNLSKAYHILGLSKEAHKQD